VTFVLPSALSLLALAPALILIYMLRRHRPRLTVSSTMLWQQLFREAEGTFNWHWPLRDLLLLFQILAVAALALAIARPALLGPAPSHRIVIVSASASMQATDVLPNRLAAAKQRAAEIIDGLNPSDRVTLIRAAAQPRILVSSSDRASLRKALNNITPGSSAANLRDSLALASAVATTENADEIDVISDGHEGDLSGLPPVAAHVRFIPIGIADSNQAILALAVRRGLAAPYNYSAFVRVANFARVAAEVPMITTADGKTVDQRVLRLPPESHSEMVIALPPNVHVLQVRLQANDGGRTQSDFLAEDDVAQVDLPPDRLLQISLVSADPRALKTVLQQLPGVAVTPVDPSQYRASDSADITVLEGFLPAELPAGNLLIVDPQGDAQLFSLQGQISDPVVSTYDLTSPLLASVDLAGLTVASAAKVVLPSWATQVIGTEEGPLVFQGMTGGRRVVVFTFAPQDTNLPFRVAFPILMANTISWLTPASLPGVVSPEQPVLIRPLPGTTEITVERPDGKVISLPARGSPVAFADTSLVGAYRVTYRGPQGELGSDQFAVNLSNAEESRIAPRLNLAGIAEAPVAARSEQVSGLNEVWPLLVGLALLLLLMEWWLYNRQAVARQTRSASPPDQKLRFIRRA